MLPMNIFFILFLTSLQVSSQLIRASFDQPCGPGIRCDSKKSLTCGDDSCKCIKPEEMVYDIGLEKCVVLVGERCTYTAMEILTEATPGERWTEKLDCVPNASCNEDGYCGCDDPNCFETPEGHCSEKLYKGENCTSDNQCRTELHLTCREGICSEKLNQGGNCTADNHCRTDRHLTCKDGICSCSLTEAIFDARQLTCIGIAGADCSKYDNKCVDNAECSSSHRVYNPSLGRYVSKCVCDSYYKKSKDGLCLPTYGNSCPGLSQCHENFACINGKCSCPFPRHQYNDGYGGNPCISYVSGPCQEKVGDKLYMFECVDNARCTNTSVGLKGEGIFECLCRQGYIGTAERKCEIAHGASCQPKGTPCDSVANLVCKDGKCSCQDMEIYDEKGQECRGQVGARCTLTMLGYCVDGTVCTGFRGTRSGAELDKLVGSCRCNSTMVTNSDRTCSPLAESDSVDESLNTNDEEDVTTTDGLQ